MLATTSSSYRNAASTLASILSADGRSQYRCRSSLGAVPGGCNRNTLEGESWHHVPHSAGNAGIQKITHVKAIEYSIGQPQRFACVLSYLSMLIGAPGSPPIPIPISIPTGRVPSSCALRRSASPSIISSSHCKAALGPRSPSTPVSLRVACT